MTLLNPKNENFDHLDPKSKELMVWICIHLKCF